MVLGQGAIGSRLSNMLIGLGLQVWGVSRNKPGGAATTPHPHWFGPDEWRGALGQMDLLFVCLPSQEDGSPIIGAAELSALPPTAVLVSISRSDVIDRQALTQALHAGQLGGAALDVAIPADVANPWQAPRLFTTNKTAAMHADFQPRLERFVELQLSRWHKGQALLDPLKWPA
jgi:phosphoglycerate dehydrogenase-like enzyme